ncbi:methyltransferase domain-containing protein [Bacillus cereus]|nr:methyltransferase domain-containing protein [Bacillus cereus]
MLGTIAYDELCVFNGFIQIFNLEGKRILEIGGSLPEESVLSKGIEEWHSVDPRNKKTEKKGKYTYYQGIASSIPVEDNYFDYVFSSNAFEHINNLSETMQEIKRVLKPGGSLYTHFGPIWSAPDGHHLEDVEIDGKMMNFWEDYIIPHWAHLLFNEKELSHLLSKTFSKEHANKIANFVYHTKWVNRLSFEDYIQIFMESGLRLCHLETTEQVDYPYVHPDYGISQEEIRLRLEKEYKGKNKKNIQCRDILAILTK